MLYVKKLCCSKIPHRGVSLTSKARCKTLQAFCIYTCKKDPLSIIEIERYLILFDFIWMLFMMLVGCSYDASVMLPMMLISSLKSVIVEGKWQRWASRFQKLRLLRSLIAFRTWVFSGGQTGVQKVLPSLQSIFQRQPSQWRITLRACFSVRSFFSCLQT